MMAKRGVPALDRTNHHSGAILAPQNPNHSAGAKQVCLLGRSQPVYDARKRRLFSSDFVALGRLAFSGWRNRGSQPTPLPCGQPTSMRPANRGGIHQLACRERRLRYPGLEPAQSIHFLLKCCRLPDRTWQAGQDSETCANGIDFLKKTVQGSQRVGSITDANGAKSIRLHVIQYSPK